MAKSKVNPMTKPAKKQGKKNVERIQRQVSTRGQPPKTNVRKG